MATIKVEAHAGPRLTQPPPLPCRCARNTLSMACRADDVALRQLELQPLDRQVPVGVRGVAGALAACVPVSHSRILHTAVRARPEFCGSHQGPLLLHRR
jgi:hypothetical protein